MTSNKKSYITICFFILISAFYCHIVESKEYHRGSTILNHMFPAQMKSKGKWNILKENNYPSFYQEMSREYKQRNPADAYFNKSLQTGVIIIYGNSIELGPAPKICILKANAVIYLSQNLNDSVPLVGKPFYLAWKLDEVDKKCNQLTSVNNILIEGMLPISLIRDALINEGSFLGKCFARRTIAKRDMELSEIALSQSLGSPDAYFSYMGAGMNIVLEMNLEGGSWHFNNCRESFD